MMSPPFNIGDHVEMTAEAIDIGLHRHTLKHMRTGHVSNMHRDAGTITVLMDHTGELRIYLEKFWRKRSCNEPATGLNKTSE